MNRTLRTAALLLTGPVVLGLGLAAAGPASAAASAAARAVVCATTSPIVVNGFAFAPAEVKPGEAATADLITSNCSASTIATVQQWTGQWLTPTGTGPAAGCPVIDPLVRDVTYSPGEELAQNTAYSVPAACTATELAVTVKITLPAGSGGTVVTATADLRIAQTSG